MKTGIGFSKTLALAVSACALVSAPALAGGLDEAHLMGVYSSCLQEQVVPLIGSVEPSLNRRPDVPTEYHDPLIGRPSLNLEMRDNWDRFWVVADAGMHFYYRNGKLRIEINSYRGDGESVKTKPLYLPYFQYTAKRVETMDYDQFGNIQRSSTMALVDKPTLILYQEPAELPLVNQGTGAPVRDRRNNPLAFDVNKYTSCLKDQVAKAYAQPQPTEAAGGSTAIEAAADSKAVSSEGSAANAASTGHEPATAQAAQ